MKYNTKERDLLKSAGMFRAFSDIEQSVTITYGAGNVMGFISSDRIFNLHTRAQVTFPAYELGNLQTFIESVKQYAGNQ